MSIVFSVLFAWLSKLLKHLTAYFSINFAKKCAALSVTNVLKLEIFLLYMPFLIFIGRILPGGAAKNLTKLLKLLFTYQVVKFQQKVCFFKREQYFQAYYLCDQATSFSLDCWMLLFHQKVCCFKCEHCAQASYLLDQAFILLTLMSAIISPKSVLL